MAEERENSALDTISKSANTAHRLKGAIKTGKTAAAASKGAAVGGPYGAVAGLVWENKETAGKIMMVMTFLMLLPILFIMMLPSIIFNGVTTSDKSIMNNDLAIRKNISDAESEINGILVASHSRVLEEIKAETDKLTKNEKSIINDPYSGSISLQIVQIISQYCAVKKDCIKINLIDLKNTIMESNSNFFSYSKTSSSSTIKDDKGKITTITAFVYTVSYVGNSYFSTNIFHLSADETELANEYAQNLFTYLYGTSSNDGGGGSGSISPDVQRYSDLVKKYASQYGISDFVDVLLAIMQQESGGSLADVMQSSECGWNTKYSHAPNSITDPEYSINCGVHEFAGCLQIAGCTSPSDISKLSLAVQGYNFGSGYINWAVSHYGGYTSLNAVEFSNMEKAKLGVSTYGDPKYVPRVLGYYNSEISVSDAGFASPFVGSEWRSLITSGFGERIDPVTGEPGEFHAGVDIGEPLGTSINAVKDGTIIQASNTNNGYGNEIKIDHGGGIITLYGHTSRIAVTVGQKVKQGDVIGFVGSSGRSTGPHLHFGIYVNGTAVNPMNYLK